MFVGGFVTLSWLTSACTGAVVFSVMYWVLPTMLANNPLFSGLGRTARTFAWLPLLVFGTLALVGFARSVVIGESSRSRDRKKSRKSWRDTSVNISRLMVNHGWGVTRQGMPAPKPKAATFDRWTLEALRVLEWKRFEALCAEYYETVGFQSETIRCGADGSIDVKLFKTDPSKPLALVQCKTGNVYTVGMKEVRELLSMMTQQKIPRGIYITTGTFNRDALNFADDHPIQLLDGDGFVRKILALPEEEQERLLEDAFQGDYKTPTCPSCAVKMARRSVEGRSFWGCVNSSKCRNTFEISR
ncbi:MAG: restriction system protein [Burkholderiales bacterium]